MDIPRNQSKWKHRLLRGLTVVAVLGALALITVGVSRLREEFEGVIMVWND